MKKAITLFVSIIVMFFVVFQGSKIGVLLGIPKPGAEIANENFSTNTVPGEIISGPFNIGITLFGILSALAIWNKFIGSCKSKKDRAANWAFVASAYWLTVGGLIMPSLAQSEPIVILAALILLMVGAIYVWKKAKKTLATD